MMIHIAGVISWALAALFIFNTLRAPYKIGEQSKPLTPGVVVGMIIMTVAVVVMAIGVTMEMDW